MISHFFTRPFLQIFKKIPTAFFLTGQVWLAYNKIQFSTDWSVGFCRI